MTTHYTTAPLRVTITARMDNDEYAGIEAARVLQKKYLHNPYIRILSLDYTPVDGKIPKLVFPGSVHGTQTEQVMHWLYETHIKDTNLWIDLHGGGTYEKLTPFVWMYQSKKEHIQKMYSNFIKFTSAPIIVYDKNPFMNYSKFLDSKSIAYILMECGDLGKRRKKDIEALVMWVDEYLASVKKHRTPTIYTSVKYVFNNSNKIKGQLLWKNVDPLYKKGALYAAYAMP